jgi:integrase
VRRLFDKGFKNDPEMRRFYTAIFTGLRTSELMALRWVDIDWRSDLVGPEYSAEPHSVHGRG